MWPSELSQNIGQPVDEKTAIGTEFKLLAKFDYRLVVGIRSQFRWIDTLKFEMKTLYSIVN